MHWTDYIGISSFGPISQKTGKTMAIASRCLFKQSTEDFKTTDDQMIATRVIRSGLLKPNHANGLRLGDRESRNGILVFNSLLFVRLSS
jgi:hypothetical protein